MPKSAIIVIIPSENNSWEISEVQVVSRYTLGGDRAEAVAGVSSEGVLHVRVEALWFGSRTSRLNIPSFLSEH